MKKTVEFVTKKAVNRRNQAITAPVTPEAPLSSKAYAKKQKYDLVMNTRQYVGGKQFCYVPMELLEVDDSYQRGDMINKAKISKLAREFDINLYDPIQIAPHPETNTFAIINGVHRYLACRILGTTGMEASIVTGLSANPEERRVQEAEIFVTQADLIDNLTMVQKHKANLLRGIPKNIILEECTRGRKLILDAKWFKNLPKTEQDKYKDCKVLSGYSAALEVAGLVDGKKTLTNLLDIIATTDWHNATNGYSSLIIRVLSSVLSIHNNDEKVVKVLIDCLKQIDPNGLNAKAFNKYPLRKERERMVLFIEDTLCEEFGIERVYSGGGLNSIMSEKYQQKVRMESQSA